MARKLQVQYERASGGDRAEAPVRDATLGGLFIETEVPFENGTLVTIELTSPSGTKLVVDARVISVQLTDHGDRPAGMAVRFLDLPDGAAGTLGPMFQQTRPPARTFLGVGSTEASIPKPPSVPRVESKRPTPLARSAARSIAAAPAPTTKVTTPQLAISPFAPPPPSAPSSAPVVPPPPSSSSPAPAPAPTPLMQPIATNQGFPPSAPPPAPHASRPPPSNGPPPPSFAPTAPPSYGPAPGPVGPPPSFVPAPQRPMPAMTARRTSPLVWIGLVALALLLAAGSVSATFYFRARSGTTRAP